MRISLLLFAILFSITAFSQIPGIKWTQTLNQQAGYNNKSSYIFDSEPIKDQGLIVAGIDTSFRYDENEFLKKYTPGRNWIAKLDSLGNKVWSSTQSSPQIDPHTSGFTSLCISASGLYVAAGHANFSAAVPSDFFIAAYNDAGTFQWQNFYGGSGIDRAYSIQSTMDGGFIIAGFTTSNDGNVTGNHSPGTADVWLIKLNASRILQWQKCYGGTGADSAYAVRETSDNGFIVAGVSTSFNGDLTGNNGLADGWVFKTNSTGNLIWQKNIGGTQNEAFKDIVENSDGTYTLTGYTGSASVPQNGLKGFKDLLVVNIAGNNGNVNWSKGYGGSNSEEGFSIKRTLGNGYLVGGYTKSTDGDVTDQHGWADAWLLNLKNDGSLIWQKTAGESLDEYAMDVNYLSASDFNIAGFSYTVLNFPHDSIHGYVSRLGNVNTIKGTLFLDNNLNGIKDVGEIYFNQATVKTEKPGYLKETIPLNGMFELRTDSGTFITTVITQLPYYNVVPASHNSTFTGYFNTDSFSFAIQPIPNKQDLNVQAISLTTARPGFTAVYKLFYKNAGTVTIPSGTLLFKADSHLTLLSSVPAFNSSNGDTLKFEYTNLMPLDSASVTLTMRVGLPPATNIGDQLSSIAIINPVAGDLTPSDDTVFLKQIVFGSFDPNDKAENFAGKIPLDEVTKGNYLNYIIRFQNTGNDTAFNIHVRDTLEAKLDWSSLQMIAASHPYNLSITDNNKLDWTFSDINLVDSLKNEPASHGFIAYRIKPKNNLVASNVIKNSASIYFDFNLPVITNVAQTLVTDDIFALPLNLISFTGHYKNPNGILEWITSEEIDVEKFEIERSADAIHFVNIGTIVSKKGLGNNTYQFEDNLSSVAGSRFFYRLKMIDNDGKFKYSNICIISKENNFRNELVINPNPVTTDLMTAYINYDKEAVVELGIYDINGRKLVTQKQKISKGYNLIAVDVSNLKSGTYFIKTMTNGKNLISRFVVIK